MKQHVITFSEFINESKTYIEYPKDLKALDKLSDMCEELKKSDIFELELDESSVNEFRKMLMEFLDSDIFELNEFLEGEQLDENVDDQDIAAAKAGGKRKFHNYVAQYIGWTTPGLNIISLMRYTLKTVRKKIQTRKILNREQDPARKAQLKMHLRSLSSAQVKMLNSLSKEKAKIAAANAAAKETANEAVDKEAEKIKAKEIGAKTGDKQMSDLKNKMQDMSKEEAKKLAKEKVKAAKAKKEEVDALQDEIEKAKEELSKVNKA